MIEVQDEKPGFLETVAPWLSARRSEARARAAKADLATARARAGIKAIDELMHFSGGGYDAGSKAHGKSAWLPGGGSPDEDILPDLADVRERNRDLIRNDPHAAGLVDTWVGNIIGRGLQPQSRLDRDVLELTEPQAIEWQRAAERVFRRWSKQAHRGGRLNFGELQDLAARQLFENGESFFIPRPIPGRLPFALTLQDLEADRVANPPSVNEAQTDRFRDGIEINPDTGEHVAYHVRNTHPGQIRSARAEDFVRIPAKDADGRSNLFHLYFTRRPEQSRGVPMMAPALSIFRDLKQYFAAELMGNKIAACFALFVTVDDPSGAATAMSTQSQTEAGRETIVPGTVKYLSPGQKVETANPQRTNASFDGYVQRNLRAIGCPARVPYELLAQDFSQTNYSSGRMALNEARQMFRFFQNWFADKFAQPIYTRILEEAFLRGELPRVGKADFLEYIEDWTRAKWIGPGWTWVDPAKEVSATIAAIDANLTTYADEIAFRGGDYEDVFQQAAREKKLRKELDLLGGAPAPEPGPEGPEGAEPEPEEPEEPEPGEEEPEEIPEEEAEAAA